jgi:hypothetical protein
MDEQQLPWSIHLHPDSLQSKRKQNFSSVVAQEGIAVLALTLK